MKIRVLMLIVLVGAVLMLMPGMVFAGGHGGGGHGGGGHGGGGHHGGGHGGGGHYGGHTNYSFSFGFGYYGPGPYYYPYYSSYYYPYYYSSYYYHPYYPYYYPSVGYADPYYPPAVAAAPSVVVPQSVVVGPDAAVVPQYNCQTPVNYKGMEQVRQRKTQLLSQLQQADKAAKLEAISELGGYSFDDQVKAALENILLSDPDAAMRKEAAISFGKVKNQGALGILEKVRVQDSDLQVRQAADWAINQIKS